jgi:hypothetical protein
MNEVRELGQIGHLHFRIRAGRVEWSTERPGGTGWNMETDPSTVAAIQEVARLRDEVIVLRDELENWKNTYGSGKE